MSEELTIVSPEGFIATPQGEPYCRESALPRSRCGAAHLCIPMEAARDELCAEVIRLREWLEGIRDYAGIAEPSDSSLLTIATIVSRALSGESEADYQYRTKEK